MWRDTPAASAEPTTTSAMGPIGDKTMMKKRMNIIPRPFDKSFCMPAPLFTALEAWAFEPYAYR